MALTNTQLVTELYIAYFNRAPDPVGLNVWVNALNNGVPISTIAADFANSQEAQALYPFLALHVAPDPATAAGFVNAVYENLLNRVPDAAGLTFWQTELDTGQITVGNFILDVIQSVNAQTGTADATTLANKVTVADFYTTTVATLNAQFSVAAATAAIAGVGSNASVPIAEAQITATTAHILFTLTGGQDTIVDNSGIGHDIVNAPLVVGASGQSQSLNVGDTVALTGPNNIANLDLGGTIGAVWPAGTTISGVQTINFQNVGDVLPIPGLLPAIIPGNDITGMTTANMLGAGASVLIGGNLLGLGNTGLPTLLTTVGMTNTSVQTFALEVQNAVLAAATAPALTVNLNNTGANTGAITGNPNTFVSKVFANTAAPLLITSVQDGGLAVGPDVVGGAGYQSMTFNVTGEDAIALNTILSNSLTTVTIAGAGGLLLDGTTGVEGSKVTTITSTAAGPVVITGGSEQTALAPSPLGILSAITGVEGFLDANAALTSVTTGAGNDWVDISSMSLANVLANGLKVDLGTGTNELVVDATVATSATALTFFNNVQVLGVAADDTSAGGGTFTQTGLTGTINVANLPASVTEIQLVGGPGEVTGNLAITNVGNNFTVDVLNAFAGGVDNLTITSTTPGSTFTTTVDLGLPAPPPGLVPTVGTHSFLGQLMVNGFGTVDLNSNGDGTFHNTINQAVFDNTPGGSETVNLAGTDALTIRQLAAPNTPLNDVALAILGNGSFLNDTDKGALIIDGTTIAGSVLGGTSGGIVMHGADLFISGINIGDLVTGSAKAPNELEGSLGNDAITGGASAADLLFTQGGADKIVLAAGHTAGQIVELNDTFSHLSTAFTSGMDYSTINGVFGTGADTDINDNGNGTPVVLSNVVTGNTATGGLAFGVASATATDSIAQQGYWDVNPGGSVTGGTVGALGIDLTLSGSFGTSADQSTVSNFVVGKAGDQIFINVASWHDDGGPNFGLINASGGQLATIITGIDGSASGGSTGGGANSTIEFVTSGGIIGGPGNTTANVVAITDATFANAVALDKALASGSYNLLIHSAPPAGATADFIVAYSDGVNVHIADVNLVSAGGAADTPLSTDTTAIHVSDMVQLTGIAATTALNGHNIHFING